MNVSQTITRAQALAEKATLSPSEQGVPTLVDLALPSVALSLAAIAQILNELRASGGSITITITKGDVYITQAD